MNFSLFAIAHVKSFILKNRLHKQAKSLFELEGLLRRYSDSKAFKDWQEEGKRCDVIYRNQGIEFVDFYSDFYPQELKEIYDPPLVLFILGDPKVLRYDFHAIVGTRKASPISLLATSRLVEKIHQEESSVMGIVSGMALGIDREATACALDCDLPILGVLGTPAYSEYPFANKNLYKRMKSSVNAVLLSELLPYDNYAKWTFPMRNRIITGIAKRIYLMETPMKSGAVSSANSALDQNKDIIVFDHELQFDNIGGQYLIQDGAEKLFLEQLFESGRIVHLSEGMPESAGNNSQLNLLAEIKAKEVEGRAKNLGNGYYFIF